MITKNFEDYPEHRLQFFALLHAIVNHCFSCLFLMSGAQLKLVVDSVVWAFRHTERNIAETGLNLLYVSTGVYCPGWGRSARTGTSESRVLLYSLALMCVTLPFGGGVYVYMVCRMWEAVRCGMVRVKCVGRRSYHRMRSLACASLHCLSAPLAWVLWHAPHLCALFWHAHLCPASGPSCMRPFACARLHRLSRASAAVPLLPQDLLVQIAQSDFATQFHQTYYLQLLQEIFAVMTDSFHKPGFKMHAKVGRLPDPNSPNLSRSQTDMPCATNRHVLCLAQIDVACDLCA